jgi:hypothetical protein
VGTGSRTKIQKRPPLTLKLDAHFIFYIEAVIAGATTQRGLNVLHRLTLIASLTPHEAFYLCTLLIRPPVEVPRRNSGRTALLWSFQFKTSARSPHWRLSRHTNTAFEPLSTQVIRRVPTQMANFRCPNSAWSRRAALPPL